ncbi:hypothetical protein ACFWH4_01395 [Streptomyces sp. NPDC127091]|uniref:hypothetical protein n=1 Tax=Streptomyces sp. NPDC127091 TaxID=3347134 RepID=UPI0036608585
MARLQILELPEGSGDDRPPFVLVVDQFEPPPYPGEPWPPLFDGVAEKIGARAVLVFEETIDIPANDTSAYLQAAAANPEISVELGGHDPQAAIDAAIRKLKDDPQAGTQ